MPSVLDPTRTTSTASRTSRARVRRRQAPLVRTPWLRPGLLAVSGISLALLSSLKLSAAETPFLEALRGTALAPLVTIAFLAWLLGSKAPALWAPPLAASLAALLLASGNQLLCDLPRMPIAALWLSGVLIGLAALLISDWAYRQLLDMARRPERLFSALVIAWFLSIVGLMYRLEMPRANWDFLQAPFVTAAAGFAILRALNVTLRGKSR